MRTAFRLGRFLIEINLRRNRFVGLGLELDRMEGGLGVVFWLPLVDLTIDFWSRNHLRKAAEQIARMAHRPASKVDWEQYAPSKR